MIEERFAAEDKRRSWEKSRRPLDPRAKMRPEGKPYASQGGVFGDVIALLPLEDGDEIRDFEQKLRLFTKKKGPLAVSTVRDEAERPLIWYAVDANDPIACEVLLTQGAASSAFTKGKHKKSAYEHAYAKRYERVVRVLNGWAHRELADVLDDFQVVAPQKDRRHLCACDCPRCAPALCDPYCGTNFFRRWTTSKPPPQTIHSAPFNGDYDDRRPDSIIGLDSIPDTIIADSSSGDDQSTVTAAILEQEHKDDDLGEEGDDDDDNIDNTNKDDDDDDELQV